MTEFDVDLRGELSPLQEELAAHGVFHVLKSKKVGEYTLFKFCYRVRGVEYDLSIHVYHNDLQGAWDKTKPQIAARQHESRNDAGRSLRGTYLGLAALGFVIHEDRQRPSSVTDVFHRAMRNATDMDLVSLLASMYVAALNRQIYRPALYKVLLTCFACGATRMVDTVASAEKLSWIDPSPNPWAEQAQGPVCAACLGKTSSLELNL